MWSVQQAKNQLSAVIEAALTASPQIISRRGRPAVVVMSLTEYDRLKGRAADRRPSFIEHLLAIPPATDEDDAVPRISVAPRAVDLE